MEINPKYMEDISKATGLEWDGGSEERLYDSDRIDVDVSKMTESQYDAMVESTEKLNIKKPGYELYVLSDCSSYEYWHEGGKHGDYNYLYVAVHITNPKLVDTRTLMNDVEDIFYKLKKYDNLSDSWD